MSNELMQFQGSGGTPKTVSSANPMPATITNGNLNGQATMANSSPVAIASDQTPVPIGGSTATGTQAANTSGNVVIKGSAGRLWNAVVTATGTAALSIYDNASTNSGTILLTIPANAAIGTIYSFPGGQPAANGIVSAGVSSCPAVTFGYGS